MKKTIIPIGMIALGFALIGTNAFAADTAPAPAAAPAKPAEAKPADTKPAESAPVVDPKTGCAYPLKDITAEQASTQGYGVEFCDTSVNLTGTASQDVIDRLSSTWGQQKPKADDAFKIKNKDDLDTGSTKIGVLLHFCPETKDQTFEQLVKLHPGDSSNPKLDNFAKLSLPAKIDADQLAKAGITSSLQKLSFSGTPANSPELEDKLALFNQANCVKCMTNADKRRSTISALKSLSDLYEPEALTTLLQKDLEDLKAKILAAKDATALSDLMASVQTESDLLDKNSTNTDGKALIRDLVNSVIMQSGTLIDAAATTSETRKNLDLVKLLTSQLDNLNIPSSDKPDMRTAIDALYSSVIAKIKNDEGTGMIQNAATAKDASALADIMVDAIHSQSKAPGFDKAFAKQSALEEKLYSKKGKQEGIYRKGFEDLAQVSTLQAKVDDLCDGNNQVRCYYAQQKLLNFQVTNKVALAAIAPPPENARKGIFDVNNLWGNQTQGGLFAQNTPQNALQKRSLDFYLKQVPSQNYSTMGQNTLFTDGSGTAYQSRPMIPSANQNYGYQLGHIYGT